MYLDKPLVCFNTMKLGQELDRVPAAAKTVYLHLEEQASLIDHTSFENLNHAIREFSYNKIAVSLVGLDRMRNLSDYHASTHIASPHVAATPALSV